MPGLLLVAVLAACSGTVAPPTTVEPAAPPIASAVPGPAPAMGTAGQVFTTQHGTDGNRYVLGTGALPEVEPVDVALPAPAVWVLGALDGGDPVFLAVDADGTVTRVDVGPELSPAPPAWEPGQPPAARLGAGGNLELVLGGSPLTHPLPLGDGVLAVVDGAGAVRLLGPGAAAAGGAARALPDTRLVGDGTGRVLYLSGPTDAYAHGVLGDAIEAGSVTWLDGSGAATTFSTPEGLVVEGISAMWVDVDGDGRREVVVTLSDARAGARLAVLDEAGAVVAMGPAVGRGSRWRHQIAVAPLGPAGEIEIVDVLTPHLGGVVEFFRIAGRELDLAAAVPGFTSHVLGSRNLDLALAADADGDGRVEVVVPTQDRTALGGIRRTADGAEVVWTIDLGGRLATNLAAVSAGDGTIWFAAGRRDGVLRIWPGS